MPKQETERRKARAPLVVFTGGGTGGHVYPGLAVIKKLKGVWDGDILWVGSRGGVERGILAEAGIPYAGIPSGKLRRNFSLRNCTDAFRVLAGIFAAFFLFARRRPCLVFSKGGYVSFPPVFAAWLLRVPVVAHESDLDPGLATLMACPFVRAVCVPYEESCGHFPARFRGKLTVTGNPVREEFFSGEAEEGRRLSGFSGDKPILLVLGGSLGARELNFLVRDSLDVLLANWDVVHQTGAEYEALPQKGYFAARYFFSELPALLAAASSVVSRAGAGSLWEFIAAQKPALLIPLRGEATRGDQVRNAALFERLGAARVLSGKSIRPEEFTAALSVLLKEEEREKMRGAIRLFAGTQGKDAAGLCADIILAFIRGEKSFES